MRKHVTLKILVLGLTLWSAALAGNLMACNPARAKDQALVQKLGQIYQHMYEVQLMLELYRVDWAVFPASLEELFDAAVKGQYWKALSNPLTGKSAPADLGMDYAAYRPDPRQAGKLLYEPIRDAKSRIADYRLYAVNDEGRLYKFQGLIMQLSDKASYRPTGVHAAAAEGRLELLEKASPAQLSALDRYGMTPLIWAALNGRQEAVRYLRSHGGRFSPENRAGYKEAYVALMSGEEAWVQEVISQNRGLDQEDESNTTPLVLAVAAGRQDWVEAMLAKGAKGAEKALTQAVLENHSALFELLLEPGKDGYPYALFAAASLGRLEMARTLLARGAKVDQPTPYGDYPLEGAAQGQLDMLRLLLDNGADINARNLQNGFTALMWATYTSQIDVLEHLLAHGARLDLQNAIGETALIIAAQHYDPKTLNWLLDHGADPALKDKAGHTAMYYAVGKDEFRDLLWKMR
ncbi:MAG: ankyrin repeat domain-containing protein [Candidatus Sericytochromatia bacterium]